MGFRSGGPATETPYQIRLILGHKEWLDVLSDSRAFCAELPQNPALLTNLRGLEVLGLNRIAGWGCRVRGTLNPKPLNP